VTKKQQAAARTSPRSIRRRRVPRPRLCLTDRLANLHLLLRARSFERWPLKVTFYAEDVYRVWTRWIGQHLELQGGNGLREGIWVGLDESAMKKATANDPTTLDAVKGIQALEVTHAPLKPHIEKSKALLASPENCMLCSSPLPLSGASTLTCPSTTCDSKSHLTCLATHFLNTEKSKTTTNTTPSLLPTTGSCPTCHTPLQWRDLVQELSLRMRGSKELEALFKQPKTRKTRKNATAGAAAVEEEDEEEEDDLEAVNMEPELDDEDDDVGDGWHQLSESESELESIAEPIAAAPPAAKRPVASSSKKTAPSFRMPKETASTRAGAKDKGSAKKKTARSKGPEVMIEDSDSDDDVEVIA
jgi:structure-specific endonuclease subunit SLX1